MSESCNSREWNLVTIIWIVDSPRTKNLFLYGHPGLSGYVIYYTYFSLSEDVKVEHGEIYSTIQHCLHESLQGSIQNKKAILVSMTIDAFFN